MMVHFYRMGFFRTLIHFNVMSFFYVMVYSCLAVFFLFFGPLVLPGFLQGYGTLKSNELLLYHDSL